jgi:hypothetical protein
LKRILKIYLFYFSKERRDILSMGLNGKMKWTVLFENLTKQETIIIASDQKKAHFPNTIVKNTDFHRKFTNIHVGSKTLDFGLRNSKDFRFW